MKDTTKINAVSNRTIGSVFKSSRENPSTGWPRTVMREGWKKVGAKPPSILNTRHPADR